MLTALNSPGLCAAVLLLKISVLGFRGFWSAGCSHFLDILFLQDVKITPRSRGLETDPSWRGPTVVLWPNAGKIGNTFLPVAGPVLATARSAIPCQKCYSFPLQPPHHPHMLFKAGHTSCPATSAADLWNLDLHRRHLLVSLWSCLRSCSIVLQRISNPLCLSWLWNQQMSF